jgi:lipopolysaccharide transport system ATP-binding protein
MMENGNNNNNITLISLQNVGVYYWLRNGFLRRQRFAALKDISFDLFQGESLGIIGRNGAGKTTLLRLLGGITQPDRGTLVNNGYKTSLLSLQVGFDPQLSGLYNAIISGMFLGFTRAQVKARLYEIVSFAELEEFIDQPVRTYSAGMKARLGFSVAFHLDPDVFLIDEVLAVGDADFRKKSLAVMQKKILSDKTIVLVSHSAGTIRQLCTRAVWIEEGVTRMEGDTESVIEAYEAFLGSFKS